MRKRYRVLLLAMIVAAVVVPFGFALSLETPSASASGPLVVMTAAREPSRLTPGLRNVTVPDGAKLFGVGTMLVALAAAMRRAA